MIVVVVVVDYHIRAVHERKLPFLEDMAQFGVFGVDELEGFELGFVPNSAVGPRLLAHVSFSFSITVPIFLGAKGGRCGAWRESISLN